MLLFRAQPPASWLPRVIGHLPEVLVDHAHLERKAATSALNLQKYPCLAPQAEALAAIAIEELQHFQAVLALLRGRGIPYRPAPASPWIGGLMGVIRRGVVQQPIDHLLCAALIEGRSCEKFQWLAAALQERDPELAGFYAGLVESEGNHYATYLLMAREIDRDETDRRLNEYLDLDARLIQQDHALPILH